MDPVLLASYEQDVWVEEDSELANAVKSPFDPTAIPSPTDWVPVDCAWAIHPYPGRPDRVSGRVQDRLVALGQLVGRPYEEIVAFVGPPSMRVGRSATWQDQGFLSMYMLSLGFDRYDICIGVEAEATV